MGWLIERLAWCALAGALLATLGSAAWQAVQDALQRGLVREPEPGGTATVLTSIGR